MTARTVVFVIFEYTNILYIILLIIIEQNPYLFTWLCNETKASYEIITGKFESNKYIHIQTKTKQSSLDNNKNSVSLFPPAIMRQGEMYIHTFTLRTINILM
jgi:hypothetical protein